LNPFGSRQTSQNTQILFSSLCKASPDELLMGEKYRFSFLFLSFFCVFFSMSREKVY
jgi:hypothetical protein